MKPRMLLAITALVLASSFLAHGAEELTIDQWLVLGPAELLASGEALVANAEAALDFDFLEPSGLEPQAGNSVRWSTQKDLSWRPAAARFSGATKRQVVYLAVYLEGRRWLQTDLEVDAPFPVRFYLDGDSLAKPAAEGKSRVPLTLLSGKHLLLIKGVLPAQGGKVLALQAKLVHKPAFKDVPAGWRVVFGVDTRAHCLAHIEKSWIDMRPTSLREAMSGG